MPAEDSSYTGGGRWVCLSIEAQELKNALDQVVFAASSNQTSRKFRGFIVLTGMNCGWWLLTGIV